MSEQPSTLRLIDTEFRTAMNSLPVKLLIVGLLSYRVVHDDGWPWWLPVALFLTAVSSGWLLGWHKARQVRRNRAEAGAA